MSETEKQFLHEMRKTLLRIFIPVMVAVVLAAGSFVIAAPFRIKAIEEKTAAIERSHVSNAMMAIYLNEWRESNSLMRESLENHAEFDKEEFARINARMDQLMQEMFRNRTRSNLTKNEDKK